MSMSHKVVLKCDVCGATSETEWTHERTPTLPKFELRRDGKCNARDLCISCADRVEEFISQLQAKRA